MTKTKAEAALDAKRDAVDRASCSLHEATVRRQEAEREEAAARVRFHVALSGYRETVAAAKASIQGTPDEPMARYFWMNDGSYMQITPPAKRAVIGSPPDCIADGDTVTMWDCKCAECRELQATHPSPETDA